MSIIYDIARSFNKMWSGGTSKFNQQQMNKSITGSSKTKGIYSKTTRKTYLQNCIQFARWCKGNYGIKKINEITYSHANQYLLQQQKEGKTPATLQTRAAAIAKLLHCTTTDINKGIAGRTSKEPIRGRGKAPKTDKADGIREFCRNTGCRKEEAAKITPEQIIIKPDGSVELDFSSKKEYRNMTKNGKGRIITKIPKSYQEKLKEIKNTSKPGEAIFSNLSKNTIKNAQLHSQRRLYAQNLYKTLCKEFKEKYGKEPKEDYICKGKHAGEKYSKTILKQVSLELGHNRLNVVIDNYFHHDGQPDE